VRWTKPTTATYPSSGTITMVISARRFTNSTRTTVDHTFSSVVVVTFNGTRYAHAVVNGTFHYTIDLETGVVTRGAP
jgi:siroheme synthase